MTQKVAEQNQIITDGMLELTPQSFEAEGVNGVLTLTHSRKAWASELGLSHEVVYRTLKALRDTKRINTDDNKITLLSL